MTKVVYNRQYGGFSISEKAVRLGREISGDPKWGGTLDGETYEDGSVSDSSWDSHGYELSRTDPILITVVERLGEEANGRFAKLGIANIPDGEKYRIDEYDGSERVMQPDDYNWETA